MTNLKLKKDAPKLLDFLLFTPVGCTYLCLCSSFHQSIFFRESCFEHSHHIFFRSPCHVIFFINFLYNSSCLSRLCRRGVFIMINFAQTKKMRTERLYNQTICNSVPWMNKLFLVNIFFSVQSKEEFCIPKT